MHLRGLIQWADEKLESMIKKITFLILVLAFVLDLSGQNTALLVEKLDIHEEVYLDLSDFSQEVKVTIPIKNNTDRTLHLKWLEPYSDQPYEWNQEISDKNAYYFSTTGYGAIAEEEVATIELLPEESFDLTLIIFPNGRAGSANYFFDLIDPLIDTTYIEGVIVYVNVLPQHLQKHISLKDIKLFPNPATSYFEITPNNLVFKVNLFNAIGQNVRSFYTVDGGNGIFHYDISDLPDGLYMIELEDSRNHTLKTLRLMKRRSRV